MPLSPEQRDILVRTILGEAADQGPLGWSAVAHVLQNRANDGRWPHTPDAVALQKNQFSAWNDKSNGGNNLVNYGPGQGSYNAIGQVVDQVFSGQSKDPTSGSVFYYAPGGMPGGQPPGWWNNAVKEHGGYEKIGGHLFAGATGGQRPTGDSILRGAMPGENRGQGPTRAAAAAGRTRVAGFAAANQLDPESFGESRSPNQHQWDLPDEVSVTAPTAGNAPMNLLPAAATTEEPQDSLGGLMMALGAGAGAGAASTPASSQLEASSPLVAAQQAAQSAAAIGPTQKALNPGYEQASTSLEPVQGNMFGNSGGLLAQNRSNGPFAPGPIRLSTAGHQPKIRR